MATSQLIQALIAELGSSQPGRTDPRLAPTHAPLDDRDTAALLDAVRAMAKRVQYPVHPPVLPVGDWSAFFPTGTRDELAALVNRVDGNVPPHLALLIAFLRLSARPQALLNQFTGRHLDYQMREVLGFRPRGPLPDRAHVVVELKKGAARVEINPSHAFTAGKDATRVEQLFRPVRSTVVGHAKVQQLCAVARSGAQLRFAPVADSADGLGAALAPTDPRWPPFGRSSWPAAPIGFALASPLLRLAEGERQIELVMQLVGLPSGVDAAALAAAFDAHFTGPKGWLGPFAVGGVSAGDAVTLTIAVPASAPAVVDHVAAVHPHAFPAAMPVVQLLLRSNAQPGYAALMGVQVRSAQVRVRGRGLRGLVVENDQSTLDAKKAFLPFGAQPVVGSRCFIGCPEALDKRLTALSVRLVWQGAPSDLSQWYANYTHVARLANGVSATLTWQDASGSPRTTPPLDLMNRVEGATTLGVDTPGVASQFPPGKQWLALHDGGSAVARLQAGHALQIHRVRSSGPATSSAPRAGFITLTLLEDFLHTDHRTESIARLLAQKSPLNEPYTPKVQEITLDYAAQSDVSRINDASQAAFTDTDVQFFQIDAFGLSREQAWLTQARPWAPQGGVGLLPAHPAAGELLVGLSGVAAGDSVSLLFQVAEGSADPQANAQALQWAVLADNAWAVLDAGELALDTTRGLRASGLVAAVLPVETSTEHTRMPAGLVWLRAAIPAQPQAACDLLAVQANALEVVFTDQGADQGGDQGGNHGADQPNDPARLASALPAGSIAKLKTPLAAVKAVTQPFASFGGALAETGEALSLRASERLRHRERAITAWDFERIVLQGFPAIHRVKCIPHASANSWLAAGHTMLVVVPDLRNRNATDPLQPRVDLDTLERVRAHLVERCDMQVQLSVRNPSYQPVRLDFKVRLRPGFGFNFYRMVLNDALVRALSPWAFDAAAPLGFGGRVQRSVLLNFVESLPYVDFVTEFRLTREGRDADNADHPEIAADAPDAILVSAARHAITELHDE